MSMDLFARLVTINGTLVINRTGLVGTYDIHLEWDFVRADTAPPDLGVASDPGVSIDTAIRKQLGLQLSSGRGMREVLVIDHLERPSDN